MADEEKKTQDGLFTLTAPVILSHPHLFEAKAFMRKGKPAGEPKFGGSFVFDLNPEHPDLKAIKALAVKLAAAKWPGRDVVAESKGKIVKDEAGVESRLAPTFKFPWTLGDTIVAKRAAAAKKDGKEVDAKADFQAGKIVIKTASKYAPRCAVLVNGKPTDLTPENAAAFKSQFYFGVKCLAQLNLVAYDKVGETGIDGVTVYLNTILSLNKGEKLASGASAAEVFKDYVGGATTEDPTKDEEIPF